MGIAAHEWVGGAAPILRHGEELLSLIFWAAHLCVASQSSPGCKQELLLCVGGKENYADHALASTRTYGFLSGGMGERGEGVGSVTQPDDYREIHLTTQRSQDLPSTAGKAAY